MVWWAVGPTWDAGYLPWPRVVTTPHHACSGVLMVVVVIVVIVVATTGLWITIERVDTGQH